MHYIICGLEHSGLRIAEALLKLNETVSIITLNKNESNLFFIQKQIKFYIEGDARNPEILLLAGIKDADYFLIFTSDEIKNIEINCIVKEVNPKIKTALLIKNLKYANIVEQGFEVDNVFHLPSIVAFPIVSACLNRNILHSVKNGATNFHFGFVNNEEYPNLKNMDVKSIEKSYKIKVLKSFNSNIINKNDEENYYNQGGDSFVYLTDDNENFGKENYVHDTKNQIDVILSETSHQLGFFHGISLSSGIRRVVLLYSILLLVSVILFKVFLKFSIVDAIYFVITTTTTVGYGDLNLQASPIWIKLYGCFLMIAGAALVATLFSVLTENIISKRMGKYVSFYKPVSKDHIIIAGLGSIGMSVINYLEELGIKILVIEKNPENANIHLLKSKIPVLIGDASDNNILLKAGIKKAKTLAALIDDDLNNINIILKGNNLNDKLHTVARIFSNDLHNKSRHIFQINNVISASSYAVPYIICSMISKNIIWAGYINKGIYCIFTIEICNTLVNSNKKIFIDKFKISPVLINRSGKISIVYNETIFLKNDKIYIFNTYESLKNFTFLNVN